MRALLLGVFLAAPVCAQTTNCHINGQNVICRATPAPTYPALTPPPAIAPPMYPNQLQQLQAIQQAQAIQAQRHDAFNKRVGDMVAAGKCTDAREYALENGQLDLEKSIHEVCVPR